ncbi:hypothetical protein OHC51_03640 [Stenotrophomonas indicatrix]|uniref:hypothetical protein n=1 Tax=Stenotrophomonas indicatrix TaxID=2045451 RepID=UPI003008A5B2
MKNIERRHYILSGLVAGVLIMAAMAQPVSAVEVNVTAEFKPSMLDPTRTTFTNTTPRGAYCTWAPAQCEQAGAYFFDIPLSLQKTYVKGQDTRDLLYILMPPPRDVQVTHVGSGEQHTVNIAFNAVSGHLTPGGVDNPAFTVYVQGGCNYVHTATNSVRVIFGWTLRAHQVPTPCYSRGDGGENGFTHTYSFQWLGVGTAITSPSPLTLRNGTYTGETTYTIGSAGADFDFGNGVTGDSEVTFRFEFTVAHEFQVNFPSASPQVNLVPIGGWEQWTQYGKAPSSLRQELPFSLTSSSPFSVALRCEHDAGEGCGIAENVSGTVVPLDVDLTMPGMTETATNRPARNYLLRREHADTDPMFAPDGYLVGRPSNLRFAVNGAGLTEMLSRPGTQWQGDVTIVFDTEL